MIGPRVLALEIVLALALLDGMAAGSTVAARSRAASALAASDATTASAWQRDVLPEAGKIFALGLKGRSSSAAGAAAGRKPPKPTRLSVYSCAYKPLALSRLPLGLLPSLPGQGCLQGLVAEKVERGDDPSVSQEQELLAFANDTAGAAPGTFPELSIALNEAIISNGTHAPWVQLFYAAGYLEGTIIAPVVAGLGTRAAALGAEAGKLPEMSPTQLAQLGLTTTYARYSSKRLQRLLRLAGLGAALPGVRVEAISDKSGRVLPAARLLGADGALGAGWQD